MRGGKRVAICCLVFWLLVASQETGAACKNLSYENRNQTDYGPLRVAAVRGVVKDAQGVPIPKACVGVFTEAGHKLVAATQSGGAGQFELNDIPDGAYRLVAKYEGFSPANAKLRMERRSQNKRSLTVQMRPAGLDTSSFIELK
jgi:Carboxypeptidase regulatory-like domain